MIQFISLGEILFPFLTFSCEELGETRALEGEEERLLALPWSWSIHVGEADAEWNLVAIGAFSARSLLLFCVFNVLFLLFVPPPLRWRGPRRRHFHLHVEASWGNSSMTYCSNCCCCCSFSLGCCCCCHHTSCCCFHCFCCCFSCFAEDILLGRQLPPSMSL